MVTRLSLSRSETLRWQNQGHVLALDLGGESWSARTWQGPGRAAAPAPAPDLTGIISHVVFNHTHRKLGFSRYQTPEIRSQKRFPSCHGMGTALLGTSRAVRQQRAVPWHRDTCQPSPCGTHWTPSGPGAVGTPRWPRGTERVCRAVLAVPLICPNPVCTRGASPAWPQGDTGEKCSVAEPAPRGTAWLGVPTAARLTGMGCPHPAATLCQDGVEPRAKHPACQDG